MKKVLVCGIGGASLGTEIVKSLISADRYEIYGCDISALAYGHYMQGFKKTYLVSKDNYAEHVLTIAKKTGIDMVVPGGESPNALLGKKQYLFDTNGIKLIGNNSEIVATCSDKHRCFKRLGQLGYTTPKTLTEDEIDEIDFSPCVVKPSVDSGGSSFVFLVKNGCTAKIYVNYLKENGMVPIVQEYIPHDEGEFTIGVLSLPDKTVYGSIAIKRIFYNKLSIMMKSELGLVSSGYTQGLVDDFSDFRSQAEDIASQLGSTGPLNIQARVRNGKIIPFEINPRFSASTYLRTMANFNELDIYLRAVMKEKLEPMPVLNKGWYLRSFTETFFSKNELKNDSLD